LTGALSKITSFGVLTAIAAAVNPIMLSVCVILAGRIVGLKQITPALLLGGQIVLFATWIGQLALIQNQPQIFVAFLTLLSIERAQADKPVTAGAALALAASIKLYPALFIIFLLAAGHRRVALPFVLFGAALGGASVALAGWPLHAVFLAQIKTIAQTVLVTPVSFSFDPLIGQTLFGDHLLDVPRPDWAVNNNPNDHAYLSYVMMAKPALWKTLNGIAVFLCIAGGALALFLARRRPKSGLNSGWIWAACMGLYALLSPLSWSYHYIAIAAFAPYVVLWIGARYGVLLLLALFVPLAFPAPVLYSNLKFAIFPFQIIGTVSLALYVCTLLRLTYSHKSPPSTTVSKP
jgi:predicted membrane-bound dolichyl-phosphate-mannose-protein mannosyltransferase